MTPSTLCAAFIKSFEKCRLSAYLPTPTDRPTIGWGSTGPDIKLGMTWTEAQAEERFARDLARFGARVSALIGKAPTTQAEYDALVSLAYNIGAENLANSTLLKMHEAGDHDGASRQFVRWNRQKGKVLNGLTRRRTEEARMYKGIVL